MKRKFIYFLIPLSIGLLCGLFVAAKWEISPAAQGQTQPALTNQETKPTMAVVSPGEGYNFQDAVINVAGKAGKAVVSVSTEYTERLGGRRGKRYYFGTPFSQGPDEDEFFNRFFGDFFGQLPEREFMQRRWGLGSGVIIDADGYILTNEHVVRDADKITVTLPDGRELMGEIKGKDARSDLAIIKINASNLPAAKLGNSDNVKIGEWVVAIGNPFGFGLDNPEPTVTVGVVSALHRSLGPRLGRDRDYNDLIQTDAAINPGNSGGPLVNLKGEVVGINVAIWTTTGGYQGIGFAIPANSAKRIITKLIEGKKILYGWLGVQVKDLEDKMAKYLGVADGKGVLVEKAIDNGPAQKSGMKDLDVIRTFDNQQINSVKELLAIVGKAEVGKKVKVNVIRDKKELALEVQVGERPQNLEKSLEEGTEEKEGKSFRGIVAQDITDEARRRFRIEEQKGVVVADVEPGSAADEAGIMPGDIIVEVNREAVNNLSDFNKIIAKAKGDCLIRTLRGFFIIGSGA
jgi:serine protease Do